MHPLQRTLGRIQPGRRYSTRSRAEWTADVDAFRDRVHTLLRGELYKDPRHPLYNFIFKYYFSMSPKCLTHYSPGMNVLLLDAYDGRSGAPLAQSSWGDPYLPVAKGYVWDPAELAVTAPKRKAMAHVLQLLQSIDKKPPSLRCYGLHEWAMVYTDETSHEDIAASSSKLSKFQTLPLRVSSEDIRRVLWPDPASPPLLRCTHFDAFRFFTEDGRVLNTVTSPTPAREHVLQLDQPGCIHVQMDLFKWAFKLYPLLSSELLLDALQVALEARELDMRASPYDLYSYSPQLQYVNPGDGVSAISDTLGFNPEPILIETSEGKRQYQKLQMALYRRAAPVRRDIIECYAQAVAGIAGSRV